MKNILIIDAGSTKTDWSYADEKTSVIRYKTEGINPLIQTDIEISEIIGKFKNKLGNKPIEKIFFYGAGCISPEEKNRISSIIRNNWFVSYLEVESDLLAASKALFGDSNGIVCILGTGSNSCLYEEGKIISQTPSLGFILGDEGSGAALGKLLINNIFKNKLSSTIKDNFYKDYSLSCHDILKKIYNGPTPSAFLASFAPFLLKYKNQSEIRNLIIKEFDNFFEKNIIQYQNHQIYKIGFVGSIAYNFKEELLESAQNKNLEISEILKEPMNNLELYYKNK